MLDKRRTTQILPDLIVLMVMLTVINYLLLRYEPQLWRAFSDVDSEIPSRRSVTQWSVLKLVVGVVLLPLSGLVVWWWACFTSPLRVWSRAMLLAFFVGMAAMYAHLSWMYIWTRDQHVELSGAVLRTITVLSLNAPIYLSVAGLIVLVLWLRNARVVPR